MRAVEEAVIFGEDSESGISSNSSNSRNCSNTLADNQRDSFNLDDFDLVDEITSVSSERNKFGPFLFTSDDASETKPEQFIQGSLTKCLKHNREHRFFCTFCAKKICCECIVKIHGSCRFEPLHNFKKLICQSALEEDRFDFGALKANVMQIQHSFEYKAERIRKEINNAADYMISDIEEKRNELLRKLGYIEKLKYKSWKHQLELCDWAIGKLLNYQKYSRKFDFRSINVFRKSIFATAGTKLDFIEDGTIDFVAGGFPSCSLGEIRISASPKKSLVVLPDVSHTNKFNACMVIIRDHTEAEVTGIDYSLSATLQDKHQNSAYLVIVNLKNGTFKILYYPTTEGKHILHVYLNSVPLGTSPYEILVDELKGSKPVSTVIIGGDGKDVVCRPWGVCADLEGRIIVTDRGHNCIKFFKEDGTFLTSFGREGSGPGEFLKPAGVAVDRVLRRIIVADKDNNRIQIFSYEGAYLSQFGERGEGDGQFSYPWDVSVNQTSLIAVSDSKNRRIQLFNEKGDFLRKFSFDIKNMREIELPRGLAFSPDGSIMVTDFNKHQVILLNENFETVKVFGSEGADVTQFFRPQSIDIDPEGRFAVADCNNHRIQVFLPNGELCAVIGTFGNKPGEINAPQGVCFLLNQRIAVAELGNNRVQIFELP